MEIRNGSSEHQAAATKTVLEEGDTSLPPARWGTINTFFISFTYFRRLGATGELTVCLHSLSGLQEAGPEVTNSKYFSREQQSCDFEIGTGDSVLLAFFHYPIQFQTNSNVISIFQTHNSIPDAQELARPLWTGNLRSICRASTCQSGVTWCSAWRCSRGWTPGPRSPQWRRAGWRWTVTSAWWLSTTQTPCISGSRRPSWTRPGSITHWR